MRALLLALALAALGCAPAYVCAPVVLKDGRTVIGCIPAKEFR